MSDFLENINLKRLANSHTLVEFTFSLKSDVIVDCEGELEADRLCVTNVNDLPLSIYGLLANSMVSRMSFHAPSGEWNEHLWGVQPTTTKNSLIKAAGTVHTALVARTHISHWPTLRSQLASLLRMPFNPSKVDMNHHPLKLSNNIILKSGEEDIEPNKEGTYGQFFPLLSANADAWKDWKRDLLSCQGKSGFASLLDAHALHDSLWHAMSLNIEIHCKTSFAPRDCSDTCTKDIHLDMDILNYLNETYSGAYRVEVNVHIGMIVPTAKAELLEDTALSTTYNPNRREINILHRIQKASYSFNSAHAVCNIINRTSMIHNYDINSSASSIDVTLVHAENASRMDSNIVDSFWNNVYEGNETSDNNDYITRLNISACGDFIVRRNLFDSRSMEFKVITTILSTYHHNIQICNSSVNAHYFHEPLPDSYSVDLSQYRYQIVPTGNNINAHNHKYTMGDGLIKDLPGFYRVQSDCGADNGHYRSYHVANLVQRCEPAYVFPLPPLPPHTALLLTYTANKRFMSREYQPIDASRGTVVPPAVLYSCNCVTGVSCRVQTTKSFILTSPIPDSSMPYNVITLVSTLLAFFLGSFINALYKNSKKSGTTEKL